MTVLTSSDGVGIDSLQGDYYRRRRGLPNTTDERLKPVLIVGPDVYEATFPLNDGIYTFAVDAGYVDGSGRFYALSDKAQVEFDIPDDYRTGTNQS